MKKRKFVLVFTIVGAILIIVGIAYAYFTSQFKSTGEGGSITVKTVELNNVSLQVEGKITFDDLDILPGHKNVSAVKVTAFGSDQMVTYNLVWKGTNSLTTPLKYYVYKAPKEEKPEVTCRQLTSGNANFRKYYEKCDYSGFENLGEVVSSGVINKTEGEQSFNLMVNEALKGTKDGTSTYYYVVLEFENKDEEQNYDINGSFDGEVTVEQATSTLADITINKLYKKVNGENQEITKEPDKSEGYTLDLTESSCDGGVELGFDDEAYTVIVKQLTKPTVCSLVYKLKEGGN